MGTCAAELLCRRIQGVVKRRELVEGVDPYHYSLLD